MASIAAFQAQIASVVEVLANAAVAEICNLVDDSYAEFQLEIHQAHKENELLKRRLKMMEIRESFYRRAHKLRSATSGLNKSSFTTIATERIVRVKVGVQSNKHVLENETHSGETHVQTVSGDKPDVLFIKKERVEDNVCEHSETEATTSDSYNSEVWNLPVDPEHFSDQNTHQSLQQEQNREMQQDLHDNRKPEMTDGGEDKLPFSGETQTDIHCDENTEVDLQPIITYAPWGSKSYEPIDHLYTEPESSREAIYRARTEPKCPDASLIDSNRVSVPDQESHLSQSVANAVAPSTFPAFPQQQPHMPRKDRFLCKFCGKVFSRLGTLHLHQKLHNKERLHYCTLCGKRFSQASSLRRHQSIHRGEKPFRCQHCNKLFSDQSNLKKHVNVHTGEKPYGCSHCGKRFNQSSNLKTHMKIHTREKPFSCQHCGQMFAFKYILLTHQQMNCASAPQV